MQKSTDPANTTKRKKKQKDEGRKVRFKPTPIEIPQLEIPQRGGFNSHPLEPTQQDIDNAITRVTLSPKSKAFFSAAADDAATATAACKIK